MVLLKVTPEQRTAQRDIILIYGAAGSGKTRVATSLPERFGKIAYIALDEGSENLDSVLPAYCDRIEVFRPDWTKDLVVTTAEIAVTNWKEQGFDTLVVDTFSNLAWKLLAHVTNTGIFQANHNSIGTPGKPGHMALPDRGDYGGVQGIIRNFISLLLSNQMDMNVLVICHEATDQDDTAGTIGGPATVGRALIAWLPARFKTVIRLDRSLKTVVVNGKAEHETKHIARMHPHGAWIARRNEASPEGNALKSLELDVDPVNFWHAYDNTTPPKKEKK